MRARGTNPQDPTATGLAALAWTLAEPDRAARLLALTGLTPDALRQQADAPAVLAAVLAFLEAHEPDLIDCAGALAVPPETLVAAREALER
ncbi:DUF3572 family protein [Sphingomonas flavalba]|uniref:DUF3572 family protein n=1 Tax=Sphingomonas flavalba TaxID=2559804 RepID=UPI0039E10BD4